MGSARLDGIAGDADEGVDELPLVGSFAVGEADLACLPSWQADGQHLLQLAAAAQRAQEKLRAEIHAAAALAERDHGIGVIRPGADADRRADAPQRLLGGKAGDILRPAAEEERTIPKNGIVLRLHGAVALFRRQAARLQKRAGDELCSASAARVKLRSRASAEIYSMVCRFMVLPPSQVFPVVYTKINSFTL